MPKHIQFQSIENFRDLGGYTCAYGETRYGIAYRCGSLSWATAEDVEKIADLGIKTIIDLRDEQAKADYPDKTLNDPRFKTVSLFLNRGVRVPHDFEEMKHNYMEMVSDPQKARLVFQTFLKADKPFLLHCTAGKDRTGIFLAILLLLNGVSFEDVNADYMMSFPYLTGLKKYLLAKDPNFPLCSFTPNVSFLYDFFDLMKEKYGSLISYCEAIGLSEDEINSLSNLLGKQEKSCGAVVFHEGKILIEHMQLGHYSMPKGHVEPIDIDEYATAKREIKEEAGLEVEILDGFRAVSEYSPFPGIFKQVVWFVAEAKSDNLQPQIEEISSLHWVNAEDAMRILSHDSDKEILRSALAFLKSKNQ